LAKDYSIRWVSPNLLKIPITGVVGAIEDMACKKPKKLTLDQIRIFGHQILSAVSYNILTAKDSFKVRSTKH
jgi:hypothetical protein